MSGHSSAKLLHFDFQIIELCFALAEITMNAENMLLEKALEKHSDLLEFPNVASRIES